MLQDILKFDTPSLNNDDYSKYNPKTRLRLAINSVIQSHCLNSDDVQRIIVECGIEADDPIVKQLIKKS